MANLFDYLLWRGDLTLDQSPWLLADSLVMAAFSYNCLDGSAACDPQGITLEALAPTLDLWQRSGNHYFEMWRQLLYTAAETRRFRKMRVHDYVNVHETDSQFSAVTCDFEDGCTIVAFRGTDGTLTGWREDANMSFETVPSQIAATRYLEAACRKTCRSVVCTGHSKGGNLAAYAASHISVQSQTKLSSVCSFDGPGLDDKTLASEDHLRIQHLLHCVIPQGSVVGLLLGDYPHYTIIHSTAAGLLQHDLFSWQFSGPHLEEAKDNTLPSQVVRHSIRNWLAARSLEERKLFVDALFSLAEPTGATTLAELGNDKLGSALSILQAARNMDPETRRTLIRLLGQFITTGANSTWDIAIKPYLADLLPEETVSTE